ncbi:hypothetical protein GF345_06285 [Candidatus Woesearchaeota archaeon]|nr:hypothetical protein [Candidatus Woesearchaeota archaeon]
MMQYAFNPEPYEKQQFQRDAAYVVATLSGLTSDSSMRRIRGEIDWGRLYQRKQRGDAPAMQVEHYTGSDEYHLRIGMNGQTPESQKTATDALVTTILGKYAMRQVHEDQAKL